jgi:hypothetical protein
MRSAYVLSGIFIGSCFAAAFTYNFEAVPILLIGAIGWYYVGYLLEMRK